METPSHHVWKAEEYHSHSSAQKNAASELLQYIELEGNEKILDVGCGDGKITANLTTYVPSGSVLGIDASAEMIDFAKKTFSKSSYFNLAFLLQDAQQLDYDEQFDVLFSSFALQWLPDPYAFFKGAYQGLKPSGYLAVTIPLGISHALEQSITDITSLPEWSPFFEGFSPGWHFRSDSEWKELLTRGGFKPFRFMVVLQHVVFDSRESFEGYVRPWFSYLRLLPDHLKEVFLKQIIDKYLDIEPMLKMGEVQFNFSRLDIVATKATL